MAKTDLKVKIDLEYRKGLDFAKDQVTDFHRAFNHPIAEVPTAIAVDRAYNRTRWTAEELVEFLYATADNDIPLFRELVRKLSISLFETQRKIEAKGEKVENVLVAQMDALTDATYFILGSEVEAGVDPQPLLDIVQEANMAKLFPDGKPRYDRANGNKIIKPDGWEAPEPKLAAEIQRQTAVALSKLGGGISIEK
jgi:predicted HAD superfamily Cof-like phosphohydrolase